MTADPTTLQELERLYAAANIGDLSFAPGLNEYGVQEPDGPILGTIMAGGTWHVAVIPGDLSQAEDFAALIVAAVNALPVLLAELGALREALGEIIDEDGFYQTRFTSPEWRKKARAALAPPTAGGSNHADV